MRSFDRLLASSLRRASGLRFLLVAAVMALGGSVLATSRLTAQEPTAEAVDIITPHITDSYELEFPWVNSHWSKEVCLGRHTANGECGPLWDPVQIGRFEVNFSPTKHVVMLLLAATIATLVLVGSAQAHVRHTQQTGHPKGFAAGIESMVLYLRNEVVLPNVGHHGNAFVPFGLTLFFFILTANLLGLIPYLSTATGNISVTATLAIITFIVVEIAGMKALMTPIMTPVEIVGKFTKPFALTIRLFANMIAGHVIILALIGLIFMFGFKVAIAPLAMALFIMFLEILVAFIQAFIFSLLAAVFIGQIRAAHH